MRRTTTTMQFGQEIFEGVLLTQISAPKIDLGSESGGWLDVFEGAWVTKPERLSADGIAELYALAEEFEETMDP
jgi:hypothetical protein